MAAAQTNIIACTEESTGRAPDTLRAIGMDRVRGRMVRAWSPYFGSYGMGGPGFFELLLDSKGAQPPEHLVLRLWGAAEWLLLDGRWLSAHPDFWPTERPCYTDLPGLERSDAVSPVLVGGHLQEMTIEDDACRLEIQRFDARHVLEVPRELARLPMYGSGSSRTWPAGDSLWDAWVVTSSHLLVP
jgi:hypothetical protein